MSFLSAQEPARKKESAAVLDFKATQGISVDEAVTLTNKFRASMAKTQVYEVLERGEMESIMKEQDMSMSDLCDNAECAVEVGKLLVAKKIIFGAIGKIGDTYSVTVRIIDVSTGKIDFADGEDYKGDTEGLLGVFDRLAQKLTGTYSAPKTWWYLGGVAVLGGAAAVLLGGKAGAGAKAIGNPSFPTE